MLTTWHRQDRVGLPLNGDCNGVICRGVAGVQRYRDVDLETRRIVGNVSRLKTNVLQFQVFHDAIALIDDIVATVKANHQYRTLHDCG